MVTRKKRTTKKRRTPAQVRATKKLIAFNRKRRGKKRRRRNPARGTYQTALAALNPRPRRRNPVRPLRKVNDYGIKGGSKWYDGVGWTTSKASAARWPSLKAATACAQKVSNHSNKRVAIHTM